MKLYLSADMEGISGIVDPTYINPGMENYERGRQLMTGDLNAVIEAALECGAEEIVVSDSHHTMNNILLEQLHPKAQLLCGTPRDFSMVQGLDSHFDAALFIGYHSRQGAPGVLSHTMTGVIRNMYINGQLVGEFGFNAIYAGLCGVPVCMVSGDDQIAAEAKQLIPQIQTAIVKKAVSRTAALCLSLEDSRAELRQKTKEALRNLSACAPLRTETPMQLTIEFAHTGEAEMAAIIPGSTYEPGTTRATCQVRDQYELYRTMRAMINLAATVPYV
ncbi:M55 family metallopeptidase [Brevibacillus fulvus]|uniref:D-amino peptidase n=1 Tax=Brevibacillus fulvus TaxID=1125967 RepID=A0A938Y159_9BACL|nr:M55 family metallopeptidase [Brevibacillus fulvus]MBM7590106.1 D-amino peptidase [Brevibacillus fulvus]